MLDRRMDRRREILMLLILALILLLLGHRDWAIIVLIIALISMAAR